MAGTSAVTGTVLARCKLGGDLGEAGAVAAGSSDEERGEGPPCVESCTEESMSECTAVMDASATSNERGIERSDLLMNPSSIDQARSNESQMSSCGRKPRYSRTAASSASTHVSSHCFASVSRE